MTGADAAAAPAFTAIQEASIKEYVKLGLDLLKNEVMGELRVEFQTSITPAEPRRRGREVGVSRRQAGGARCSTGSGSRVIDKAGGLHPG